MFHDPRRIFEAETSKPQNVSQTLRRFIGYFKPYWRRYLGVLVMLVASTWASVTAPQLLGQAVDCYLVPPAATAAFVGAAPSEPGAAVQAADSTGLYAIASITTGLMFYWMTTSGQKVLRTLRVEVFHHILRLPIGYHVAHESGDTMSRVTNDADTIQQAVSFALIQVLSGAFLIVWVAYKMLSESVAYGLVALAMLPFMIVATAWFSAQARKAFPERGWRWVRSTPNCRKAFPECARPRPSAGRMRTSPPSAKRMPPTATPTSAPWPTPRRWRPPSRRWATWRWPWWPSPGATPCSRDRRCWARPSPWG